MVGVENQYMFFFNVGPIKDFIEEGNLTRFKLIEVVGNILPMFQLEFQSHNDELTKYLNEGNTFKVSFGKDLNKLTDTTLYITKLRQVRFGEHLVSYNVTGLYDAYGYLTNCKTRVISKCKSIPAITQLVSSYFKMSVGDVTTNDSMAWVQNTITDRNMVNNIWMHSYIPKSMMAVGITSDGYFRVRDLKKLASKPNDFKWRFVNKQVEEKDIPYDSNALKSNTGMTNFMFGYGRKKLVNDLESGTMHYEEEDAFQPFFAMAPKLNRSSKVEKRPDEHTAISSSNHHTFYHKCYLQNVINLSVFGAVKMRLTYKNMLKKINVLDLVYFKEEQTLNTQHSSDPNTGLWVVSKVGLLLENKKLTTYVDIVREAHNTLMGGLK